MAWEAIYLAQGYQRYCWKQQQTTVVPLIMRLLRSLITQMVQLKIVGFSLDLCNCHMG